MTSKKSISLVLSMFALMVLAVPIGGLLLQTPTTTQSALAQLIDADTFTQEITDEVDQEIEQEAEQEAEQEQEQEQENEQSAEQSNTADVSQDESNEQANVIETGDNAASTTQVGENDAIGNEVEAESEGGDSGDASAELSQSVENEATTIQDSSADGNILSNENEFGDDIAIVDQENIADQDAANIGIQEQDLTQTIDQVQDAANLNVDFDVQVGVQQPLTQPLGAEPIPGAEPLGAEPECPSGFTFNPGTGQCEQFQTAAPQCLVGTFNPDTDLCEGTVIASPVCPGVLTFNPALGECVGPGGPAAADCPPGTTFAPSGIVCTGPVTAPPECPPDFTYNPRTNQCERTVTRPPT